MSAPVQGLEVHRGTYVDSMLLMAATVTMDGCDGVSWAGAAMASARGLADLAAAGFTGGRLEGLGGNDLVLAVRADDDDAAAGALVAGWELLSTEQVAPAGGEDRPPTTIAQAVRRTEGANVAIISVPGEYAALEAHHALTAGLHVLLFSDGVPLEQEIELKDRAAALGLLVMGPGAGTAVLAGTGLCFSNTLGERAPTGAVGVVAAAGTGAQEVSALLARWGVPVSQVIGVGGRDLSEPVAGRMAQLAVRALDADPRTDVVLLVSKPPAASAAARVLAECVTTRAVAVFLGLDAVEAPAGVHLSPTLEEGSLVAARLAGATPPPLTGGLVDRVTTAVATLGPDRRTVRGLFSGGTLCYEAQYVLEGMLGPVHSNEPLRKEHAMPAPEGAHVLLDLGAEEYTRGVPHPMIDLGVRVDALEALIGAPEVAVVLLDVVLGHSSHEDPAAVLAPVCARLMADGGPVVVVHVLGTESDPQGYTRQRAALEAVGCLVGETNARAAWAAGAIVLRDPALAASGTRA